MNRIFFIISSAFCVALFIFTFVMKGNTLFAFNSFNKNPEKYKIKILCPDYSQTVYSKTQPLQITQNDGNRYSLSNTYKIIDDDRNIEIYTSCPILYMIEKGN